MDDNYTFITWGILYKHVHGPQLASNSLMGDKKTALSLKTLTPQTAHKKEANVLLIFHVTPY